MRSWTIAAAAAALMLWITAGNVSAQTWPEWDMFFLGGYANGRLTGGSDRLLGQDHKDGFTGGVGVQLRLQDAYAVEIGLGYLRKGGGGTVDSTFAVPNLKDVTKAVGEADVSLDYIQIPIVLAGIMDLTNSSYLRLYAGPCLNLLTRAHLTGTVEGESVDQDIKSTMQSAEVTGLIGASYVYDLETWRLVFDANYQEGFSKVTNAGDIKTRTFEIQAGVGIPLAR
jgi:opacity protein-like surface antigen